MALIALIATDEDVQRFSAELQSVLSSLPTTTSHVATAREIDQPVPTTSPAVPPTTSPANSDNDPLTLARVMRSRYADARKRTGSELSSADKAFIKANGVDAFMASRSAQPAAPTVDPSVAAMQADLVALQERIAASSAAHQPASQPQSRPQSVIEPGPTRFDTLPLQSQLGPSVCQGLRDWALNLTPLRQDIIVRYANGQVSPADVHSVYGDKVSKVLAKVNSLVGG